MTSQSVWGRHTAFLAASGELTEGEITSLYGGAIAEAEDHFRVDPSYFIDIANSGSHAASKRERRTPSS